ncbi:MAG: phosphoglycolate phosphatase [Euryarchaeota archaeon]|nr:phosphoglycolate phosphatase [Euryarchaeota archaeon]
MIEKIEAIASDYDRTLTDESLVISENAVISLKSARKDGIKVFLVSGRKLSFLERVNEGREFVDMIVAENGAIIYNPGDGRKILLGDGLDELKAAFSDVDFPVDVEEVIVATTADHLEEVREIIERNNLSVDIELNRDDVMVMPAGVNKCTGVLKAAEICGIDRQHLAGIGDAENDLKLFAAAGTRVAVANAVQRLKDEADIVCSAPYGDGVSEFVRNVQAG